MTNARTTSNISSTCPVSTLRYGIDFPRKTSLCQVVAKSDSETAKALNDLVSSSKRVLRAELAFVVHVMAPLHKAIQSLQKESGCMLDVLETFNKHANPPKTVCFLLVTASR